MTTLSFLGFDGELAIPSNSGGQTLHVGLHDGLTAKSAEKN